MNNKILQEDIDSIVNQSNWGFVGVKLTETKVSDKASAKVDENTEADEDSEQITEGEDHVCPLCESHLDAEISDDNLREHLDLMVSILNEMDDLSDEDIEELAEAVDEDQEATEEA
jgi:DNA repair exonuclease SbcCD ATPase subunit